MKVLTAHKDWALAILLVSVYLTGNAQANVPDDASSVVNLSLEDGQARLQQNGDKKITSVTSGNEKKCIKGTLHPEKYGIHITTARHRQAQPD